MKKLLVFIFSFVIVNCQAQFSTEKKQNSGFHQISSEKSRKQIKSYARKDIADGFIILIICAGHPTVIFATDSMFERKYKVYLFDYGCVYSRSKELKQYNREVSRFLTKEHGPVWKKELRPGVIGIRHQKRSFMKFFKTHGQTVK